MELTSAQIEAISASVADKLKSQRHNRVVSNEIHNEHHMFIAQFKERVELDDATKRKIVQSGKIWAFVLFLGFTGAACWNYFIQAIEKGSGQ